LRIALVSADFPPNVGGVAAHVYELGKALAKLNHEVDVLTLPLGKTSGVIEEMSGMSVYRIKSFKNEPFFTWIFKKFLEKYIANKKPDVIHVHGMRPLMSTKGIKVPVVFTNHTSGYLKRIEKGGRELEKIASRLQHISAVIAPSEELCEATRIVGYKKPVKFISNGVDIEKFVPKIAGNLKSTFGWSENDVVVLLARRLVEKNGVNVFANAAAQVNNSKAKFLFAGDGPERAQVEKILKDGGVTKNCRLLGNVPNDRMIEIYQSADISVLPSFMEATSITGLESMSCGLPLIGTRVGGIPFLINDHETGLLVNPGSANEISSAINRLIEHPGIRKEYGLNARKRVEHMFSWLKIAEKTIEIYRRVR